MKRSLCLRSERLSELTSDELTLVAGAVERTGYYPTGNVAQCVALLTGLFTGTTTGTTTR